MDMEKRQVLLLAGAALLLYWMGNWMIPVTDPVESNYTLTAKEMLESGDFMSPRIFGNYWYDKPIFFYWELIAAFGLFGVNDFAARMPAGIFGVIGLVMTYFFARRLYDARTGMMAALILGTSFGYWIVSKSIITDLTLFVFFNAVLVFFYLAYTGKDKRLYYLCYIAAGLAVLTKGPIGILLPGFIVTVYIFLRRDFAAVKEMKPKGFLLFFAVTLLWYGPMIVLHGQAFIDNFLGVHNVLRATQSEHPMWDVWWYYSVLFFIALFPWCFTLPMVIRQYFRQRRWPELDKRKLFLLVWALSIYVFYQLMATKYTTYTLPASLPIAILMARFLVDRAALMQRVLVIWSVSLVLLTFFVTIPLVNYRGFSCWETAEVLKERVLPDDLLINCGSYKVSIPYYSGLFIYQGETAEDIERRRPDGKSWNAKNVMPFWDIQRLPEDRRIYLIVNNRYYDKFEKFFVPSEWEKIGDFPINRLYVREPRKSRQP